MELQYTTGLPVLNSCVNATVPEKNSDEVSLVQRVANSIVAEYLKTFNFEYALSTFLPESGSTFDKVQLYCNDYNEVYIESIFNLFSLNGLYMIFLYRLVKFINNS